jgi:hypothetical protein
VNIEDFHEGLNLASIWKLSVIFVCGWEWIVVLALIVLGIDLLGRVVPWGAFVASIYPPEGKITVVSKYLRNVKRHGGFPPVAEITFRIGQ